MNESMEVVKMSDCERIKENWKKLSAGSNNKKNIQKYAY